MTPRRTEPKNFTIIDLTLFYFSEHIAGTYVLHLVIHCACWRKETWDNFFFCLRPFVKEKATDLEGSIHNLLEFLQNQKF